MKKLFISVLAIAGLVACTQEQTLVQQGPAPMEFGGAFVENATNTRAAEDPSFKTATLEAFDVWAWMDDENGMVLTGEDVQLADGKWGYTNIQYWYPGHDYYFEAVAPMNSDNWKYDLEAEENTISFSNVDGTEDLLYATATQSTKGDDLGKDYEAVKLTFKHLLSKTKFTFKNAFPTDNVSIVVKNVEMTSFAEATYNTVTKSWSDVSGDITLAYGDVEKTFSGDKTEAAYERLTIPADASKVYTVTYDLYVYQGENLAYTILGKETTVTDVAFQQGKAYNFVATFTPDNVVEGGLDPIEFEVEVEDWVYAGQDEGQIEDAELRAALQLGGEVTLEKDYTITESLIVPAGVTSVINLNGHNIINATDSEELGEGDGIVVYGHLTINGNGTVQGKTRSVWARGNDNPTVTINGGNYVGAVGGSQCEVIYASGNGVITINGGTFEAQTQDTESFAAPQYAVLNIHGNGATGCDIVVYGGSFKNFDPANNISENPAKNFCAPGYRSTEVEDGLFVVSDSYVVVSAAGLQAALNEGVEEIRLAANIEGDVTYEQVEGSNVVIDGAGFEYDGSFIINGLSILATDRSLVIKNVNFVTEKTSSMNFIGYTSRYPRNITIDNCTFTAPEGDVVAIKLYQAYNVVVKNCTVNGGHSLAQITSSTNVAFESNTVNSLRGINLGNSVTDGAVVKNCKIVATKADGYAVRVDNGNATIEGCDLTAFEPVVLRKMGADQVITFAGNTLTAGGEYQIFVDGVKPVMNGAEAYTCNK